MAGSEAARTVDAAEWISTLQDGDDPFRFLYMMIGGIIVAKTIKSYPGMFGQTNHYDEHGKKIGESWPGLFGGTDHYDTRGHKIGHTMPGVLDDQIHYDSHGHRVGRSLTFFFGYETHYGNHGNKVGYTRDSILFGKTTKLTGKK